MVDPKSLFRQIVTAVKDAKGEITNVDVDSTIQACIAVMALQGLEKINECLRQAGGTRTGVLVSESSSALGAASRYRGMAILGHLSPHRSNHEIVAAALFNSGERLEWECSGKSYQVNKYGVRRHSYNYDASLITDCSKPAAAAPSPRPEPLGDLFLAIVSLLKDKNGEVVNVNFDAKIKPTMELRALRGREKMRRQCGVLLSQLGVEAHWESRYRGVAVTGLLSPHRADHNVIAVAICNDGTRYEWLASSGRCYMVSPSGVRTHQHAYEAQEIIQCRPKPRQERAEVCNPPEPPTGFMKRRESGQTLFGWLLARLRGWFVKAAGFQKLAQPTR